MQAVSAEAPQETPPSEPWSRYFSAEGIYLRPPVDPKHASIWRGMHRLLKWGIALAVLSMVFDQGSVSFGPRPFALAGLAFFVAVFQLLGAYVAFFVLDPPAMPRVGRWELAIPYWPLLLLAILCSWGSLLFVAATTWIPAMLLRWVGCRIVYAPDYVPDKQEMRFSLSGLFGLTTCVALVLGIVSGLLRLSDNLAAVPLILLGFVFACGVSPLTWFLPRPLNLWFGGFALGVIAGIAAWVIGDSGGVEMFILVGSNLAICHGVAIAVHRAGFRLLRLPKKMRRPGNPYVWVGEPRG